MTPTEQPPKGAGPPTTVKRILLVDDEPNVLEGIERMLFPMRKQWQVTTACGGVEALQKMKEDGFDIVISDMRMPGMDGATLLSEVMRLYPETIRFILTGQSGKETVFQSIKAAHQLLAKPCTPEMLKSSIDRAFALRELLGNKSLANIVSKIGTLPALPETYNRLVKELEEPEATVQSIGRIIQSDLAMTAKVLQLVNSAYFGLRQRVGSAIHAVTLLGLDTIKSLVLVSGIFSQAKVKRLPFFSLDTLWQHSMAVGAGAQAICKVAQANENMTKDAFTAGLLHDVGTLILAEYCPDSYKNVVTRSVTKDVPLSQAEQDEFGCTHAGIGAYLLGLWGLHDSLVEAVAFHHNPMHCPAREFTPLAAVHVSNALSHENDEHGGVRNQQLDAGYIDSLEMQDKMDAWRQAFQDLTSKESTS